MSFRRHQIRGRHGTAPLGRVSFRIPSSGTYNERPSFRSNPAGSPGGLEPPTLSGRKPAENARIRRAEACIPLYPEAKAGRPARQGGDGCTLHEAVA